MRKQVRQNPISAKPLHSNCAQLLVRWRVVGGIPGFETKFCTTTGELSEQVIGSADSLEQAKAIAQALADQHARKKPTVA